MTLLRNMELAVGELASVLDQSQPRVSRHVKILCDAGLASRRKEGSWVFLVPGDANLLSPVFMAIDHLAAIDRHRSDYNADVTRLNIVRAERSAAAQRYFERHAGEWDAMRALHKSDAAVETHIIRALAEASLETLVDLGTGTGRMIALCGGRARKIIGIDRSPEMLRLARVNVTEAGLSHSELRQGDIQHLTLADASATTVILHQVLHYLLAPEEALLELGRITADGGTVLIIDFAPHQLEQLRERDAHVRLGFADAQIIGWMTAAGLDCDLIDSLPGDPLTVKIWRGIKRTPQKVRS